MKHIEFYKKILNLDRYDNDELEIPPLSMFYKKNHLNNNIEEPVRNDHQTNLKNKS